MWKSRNVWIILSGEMIAGFGLWMSIIANLEFMQRYVPSDFLKSLILFTGLLAGVLFGPLAGRVIDSVNKKHILLYSGVGRLVSVSFMFAAIHYESVWWMVLFAVALQISAAFYFPALQSLIPLVVEERQLLTMNGVHMNVMTIARIMGTALGGFMLTVMSLSSLYALSFAAYVLLLVSTFFLQVKDGEGSLAGNPAGASKPKGSFKDVIPVLKELPVPMMVLCLTVVPTLFIGGFNLLVINISELQNDPQIKGWLYAAEGTLFILGGFLVKRLSERRDLLKLLFFFAFVVAFAHLSLYFSNYAPASVASFAVFGLAAGCMFPVASTLFQTQVPREYHGRFFSFRSMLDRVLFQVILLGTGLFLDTIGLQLMVLLFGALSLGLTIYFLYRQRKAGVMHVSKESGVPAEKAG
jgi:MFS transporter, DHA3 family, macrolide efflux protein